MSSEIGVQSAQKTVYKGIEYRSKLEAKTAQALDNLDIPYEYEPQGFQLSNGLWYRPDFWLPNAMEYVECKGEMKQEDMAKIAGLAKDTGFPVLVISYENSMLLATNESDPENSFVHYSGNEVALLQCRNCGSKYFGGIYGLAIFHSWCSSCAFDNFAAPKIIKRIDNGQTFFELGQKTASNNPQYAELASIFNR